MEGLVNTISSAASTLIELIPRPVRAFGGRIVDAVSFIKNTIFGESSPDATHSTSLQQRTASTVSSGVSTEPPVDPGSPLKHPNDTNIGVIGTPGTSKSSLINALLDLDDDDQDHGAAVTGLLLEPQTVTERYQLDGSRFLCELPSPDIGNPDDSLADRSGLDHYDALVMVRCDANVEKEILQLTRRAIAKGIPVYVVRTKMDAVVSGHYHERAAKATMEEPREVLYEKIKDELVENFRSEISPDKFYLCSNHERSDYELDDLKRSLLQVEKRPVSEQQ